MVEIKIEIESLLHCTKTYDDDSMSLYAVELKPLNSTSSKL